MEKSGSFAVSGLSEKEIQDIKSTLGSLKGYEVLLAIDDGSSMAPWAKAIDEVRNIFRQLDLLQDGYILHLATDDKERIQWSLEDEKTLELSPNYSPDELVGLAGRLILVITDCVSPAWHSGEAQEVLKIWEQQNLVSLIQVLPRPLWLRTALRTAKGIKVRPSSEGLSVISLNAKLKVQEEYQRLKVQQEDDDTNWSSPIPIIALEASSLRRWMQMVTGVENTWVSGIKFNLSNPGFLAEPLSSKEKPEGEKQVQRFLATASPKARQLAGLLASAPISIENIHFVQQHLLPESRPIHVAEVFLSGLLKKVSVAEGYSSAVAYDFISEVRSCLVETVPLSSSFKVYRLLEERDGLSDVMYLLTAQKSSARDVDFDKIQSLASIKALLLSKVGCEYQEQVRQLEDVASRKESLLYSADE